MGFTEEMRQKISEIDTEKYDWYICEECGGIATADKASFIKVVMQRGKKCIDCKILAEKEKNVLANRRIRAKKKLETL